jgi:hypothetical protein
VRAHAAKELDKALIGNPHKMDALAAAMKRALEMRLGERRERHAPIPCASLEEPTRGSSNARGIVANKPAMSEAASRAPRALAGR